MKIPIIADESRQLSTDYGVLVEGGDDDCLPMRAVFIIDPKGVLKQITVNDLPIGRNVDEIFRLVEAFQYAEISGDVCPVNWKKGDRGITVPEEYKVVKRRGKLSEGDDRSLHLITSPYPIINYSISGAVEAILGDIVGSFLFKKRQISFGRVIQVGLYGKIN
jgi:hypothetical protein